jgi:S1-C subfamily serine protease
MFADAVAKISESIFPIFFAQEQGDECILGVCGTGFFVDDSGLFVTADHFMTPQPPGYTYYYYGKIPDEVCELPVEVERIANDPGRDLFLGRIARSSQPPVELSNGSVRPGNSVCLAGYPMAIVVSKPDGGFTGNVRRYWQPTFVIDATQAVIGGRVYDGYIVQHTCLPGMSGGPVFDVEGKVRGMGVAALTRTIPEPEGQPIVVSNGIVSDVAHIRKFIEAHAAR